MAVSTTVDVKVPKRSGFDKSFQNLLTTKVGTLTPLLVDEVIPNSVVDLDAAISATLPPLASDTFMRCDLKAEAFFVPHRILYGGYEDWLTHNQVYNDTDGEWVDVVLPSITMQSGGANATVQNGNYAYYKPGTLMDYLGFKMPKDTSTTVTTTKLNPFPILAYHKIYDDWYRNTQVQETLFRKPSTSSFTEYDGFVVANLPFVTFDENGPVSFSITSSLGASGSSGLGVLHQRNFGLDYFTTASLNPQQGDPNKVTFSTSGSTGEFTIAALRAANSLQQFAERNNLAGKRMQDYVKAHFGANLSTGVAQRAVYLGSASYTVYSKGISQTAESTQDGAATQNPFTSVGAQYGRAYAAGNGKLIDHFEVAEPGTIMVLVSLVPKVSYASGVDRMLTRYTKDGSQVEMADPLLQNTGNQPIFAYELSGDRLVSSPNSVFGYTDRFAEFKTKQDQVHGLLRDGESLQSFVAQRTITGAVSIDDSTFLPIPTSYLDQVAATANAISDYGVWIDSFMDYKVSMPLAEYSIPSLQDPAYEHGNDIKIDIRGSKL